VSLTNTTEDVAPQRDQVFHGTEIYIHPPKFSLKMALKSRNM